MKLSGLELRRPRAFGNCWLACETWRQLELDRFRRRKLPEGREAVSWEKILRLLVVNRLIDPGGELYVHRHWFLHSAMEELRGIDFAVAEKDRLYRCLDRVISHKRELFMWLRQRGPDLFQAGFEVPLHDLTGTYFEGAMEENPKAKRGCGRDGRPDCSQVVIAPVVTTDGFPTAYEARNGNTSDRTALRGFLDKIEAAYGKAGRMWVMDRGIPTEEILAGMRDPARQMSYLVGTPKSKIKQHEKKWLELPWRKVRDSVEVKLFERDGELYVPAKSEGRQLKEAAMRRKRLVRLLVKLRAMRRLAIARSVAAAHWRGQDRSGPGLRLGADSVARWAAAGDARILPVQRGQEQAQGGGTARWPLSAALQCGRRRSAVLWTRYVQLTQIESVFRSLKSELGIRPVHHRLEHRVDAHILVAFLAYRLQVALKNRLMLHAPGLTPAAVLEKLSAIRMIDVWVPAADGRRLILPRYTQPERDLKLLLEKLPIELPVQPPPRITSPAS